LNLEHHRKDAKRLVRAFRVGDADAVARAEAILGPRARARFVLTDAQHVIAVELGLRSWPDLTRAVRVADAGEPDAVAETRIDTGLHYRPGDPVCVGLVRRERRISVTDHGAAIDRAGRPSAWREVAHRVGPELDVNITRLGVIWLPVVTAGPGEEAIVSRIAAASLSFYQQLLDLDG
jgi:hypothetical protein